MRGTLITVILVIFGFPAILCGQKADTLPCPERRALYSMVRFAQDSSVLLLRQEYTDTLLFISNDTKAVLYKVGRNRSTQKVNIGKREFENGKEMFVNSSGVYVVTEWNSVTGHKYAITKLNSRLEVVYRKEFEGIYLASRLSDKTLQFLRYTKNPPGSKAPYSVSVDYISTKKGKRTATSPPYGDSLQYNRIVLGSSSWYGVASLSHPGTNLYSGARLDRISIRSGERTTLFSADENTFILDIFPSGDSICYVRADRIIDTLRPPLEKYKNLVSYKSVDSAHIHKIDSINSRFYRLQQQTAGYRLSFVRANKSTQTVPGFAVSFPLGYFIPGTDNRAIFLVHTTISSSDSIISGKYLFSVIADPYTAGSSANSFRGQTLANTVTGDRYCGLVFDNMLGKEVLFITTLNDQ